MKDSDIVSENEEFNTSDRMELSAANIFEDSVENPKPVHLKVQETCQFHHERISRPALVPNPSVKVNRQPVEESSTQSKPHF